MTIPDAYQEYVQARRETEPVHPIATLTLPVDDMVTIWDVLDRSVHTDKLEPTLREEWRAIMSKIAKAVREAA